MTQFAKLFQDGSSQAVELPKEFRFKGDKVRIRRLGKSVVLDSLMDDPEALVCRAKENPCRPGVMKERRQPKISKCEKNQHLYVRQDCSASDKKGK